MDYEHSFLDEAARKAADFQDMHGRKLFERNGLKFDARLANPKKLEAAGYAVDIIREHRGDCTHYKMRLLKIVDIEEYSIKYTVAGGSK